MPSVAEKLIPLGGKSEQRCISDSWLGLGFSIQNRKADLQAGYFFEEGRGCRITVQLVHLALTKGEAVLENTP